MKPGDRVTTSAGPGTIVQISTEQQWNMRRHGTDRIAYVTVHLDHEHVRRVLPPHAILEVVDAETRP